MASLFAAIANRIAQEATLGLDSLPRRLLNKAGTVPLMGGINLATARDTFLNSASVDFSKKGLWLLQITDISPLSLANNTVDSVGSMMAGGFNVDTLVTLGSLAASLGTQSRSVDFNLFATDVSYAPVQITGDAQKVGTASFSKPIGRELVEMRITTLDDRFGSLKKWAKLKSSLVALPNGTMGLPITYLLKVRIKHGFSADNLLLAENAYEDEFVMYVSNVEADLTRREDGFQDVQLTLTQFDTFTNLI